MLKNNVEVDVKVKCIEENVSQVQLAEAIGTSALYMGIMDLVFKGDMSIDDLGTKKGKDAMSALFKKQLKMKK